MVLTGKSREGKYYTVDKVDWERRYALLPVLISKDGEGVEKSVWLDWYETRTFYEEGHGWWRELRFLGSPDVFKEDANRYDF